MSLDSLERASLSIVIAGVTRNPVAFGARYDVDKPHVASNSAPVLAFHDIADAYCNHCWCVLHTLQLQSRPASLVIPSVEEGSAFAGTRAMPPKSRSLGCARDDGLLVCR